MYAMGSPVRAFAQWPLKSSAAVRATAPLKCFAVQDTT